MNDKEPVEPNFELSQKTLASLFSGIGHAVVTNPLAEHEALLGEIPTQDDGPTVFALKMPLQPDTANRAFFSHDSHLMAAGKGNEMRYVSPRRLEDENDDVYETVSVDVAAKLTGDHFINYKETFIINKIGESYEAHVFADCYDDNGALISPDSLSSVGIDFSNAETVARLVENTTDLCRELNDDDVEKLRRLIETL